jgi:hypothetical protein
LEEQAAVSFDVIYIKKPRARSLDQFLRQRLSFDQRQSAEILAIQLKKIKREENALPSGEQQVSERWPARFVNAGNLAIQNGAINANVFRDPSGQLGKSVEHVAIARNQFALIVLKGASARNPSIFNS